MKVIFDTKVFVSPVLRDRNPEAVIVWVAERPGWQWVVSTAILHEYHQVLNRKKFSFPPETIEKWENVLVKNAKIFPVSESVNFPRDQKDAKFLACAISNHVDYLVTGDADFTEAHKLTQTTILSVSLFKRLVMGGI